MSQFIENMDVYEVEGYHVQVIVKPANKHAYIRLHESKSISITTPVKLSKNQVVKHVKDFLSKQKEKSYVHPDSSLGNYFEYKGFNISLNRKARNKHVNARLKEDGSILVSGPFHTPNHIIYSLLDKLIEKLESKVDLDKAKKTNFQNGDTIYILGQAFMVKIHTTKGKEYVSLDKENYLFNVHVKDVNNQTSIDKQVDLYIGNAAKKILRERFNVVVESFHHIDFMPILKIRRMKTKYGVCYYKRNEVALSTLLMHYDAECIDYVIIHELSHFIVPNHSKKFYHLIEQYMPHYKNAERKLKNVVD